MIRGGVSLGTFPPENFAPLSPYRCLRSFSASLLSRVRMNVCFIKDNLWSYPPPHPHAAGIVGLIPAVENTLLICLNRLANVSSLSSPTSIILLIGFNNHRFSVPPPDVLIVGHRPSGEWMFPANEPPVAPKMLPILISFKAPFIVVKFRGTSDGRTDITSALHPRPPQFALWISPIKYPPRWALNVPFLHSLGDMQYVIHGLLKGSGCYLRMSWS